MNELMNERKSIMKKKIYSIPQTEVLQLETSVIMEAFGPASMPTDPFSSPAPKRKTEVF